MYAFRPPRPNLKSGIYIYIYKLAHWVVGYWLVSAIEFIEQTAVFNSVLTDWNETWHSGGWLVPRCVKMRQSSIIVPNAKMRHNSIPNAKMRHSSIPNAKMRYSSIPNAKMRQISIPNAKMWRRHFALNLFTFAIVAPPRRTKTHRNCRPVVWRTVVFSYRPDEKATGTN